MVEIRILPDHVVNRIAAGEVVERPASVVKELLENSLDAEALKISLELEAGGRRLIRVADDGLGMNEDQALLALERHATSKLRQAEDLESITTMGFRGEALPSIAAVSRLLLYSSADPSEGGVAVNIEGGRILGVQPRARARGTTVEVRDLFFNTPARRKFLHAPETELRHVQDAVVAIGMANPEVGLRLSHGGRLLLEAPARADFEQRFRDLFRKKKFESIHHFEASGGGAVLEGLLGRAAGSGRPQTTLLVNGRWVRDRLMIAAVYRVLRSAGREYAGSRIVLALKVPPNSVDVNVHPAKAEVRFTRSGAVFALIEQTLRKLLESGHSVVSIPGRKQPALNEFPGDREIETRRRPFQETLFRHPVYAEQPEKNGDESAVQMSDSLPEYSYTPPKEEMTRSGARARGADTPFGRLLAQYRDSFLLLEDDHGLVIVDQHVAHERVLYEVFLKRLTGRKSPSQGLLIPVLVEIDEALLMALERVGPLLDAVGIEAEAFGPETLRILALPPELDREQAAALVEEILESATSIDGNPESVTEKLREEIAASCACRAAIKVNCALKEAEQRRLLEDLAITTDPYRCPHGRPILIRLGQDEMERRLGRR